MIHKGESRRNVMADIVLEINDLHVSVDDVEIIQGLNITINKGEIHAIMGRNGSGKSTLANVLMGHPDYKVTSGSIVYQGNSLLEMEVYERARSGIFLSFQYPSVIPGVQVGTFLRKSINSIKGEHAPSAREFRKLLSEKMVMLDMNKSFLSRYVNDGFSGGEKKRLEILQLLLLEPSLIILDETDSGLDIDALRVVSEGINSVLEDSACLVITHYQRLLDYVKPDHVHAMIGGCFVKSGGPELAHKLEANGYDWLEPKTEVKT